MHVLTGHRVDYAAALRGAGVIDYPAVAQRLLSDLPPKWHLQYREMCRHEATILTAVHAGMFVHVDLAPEQARRERPRPNDRVVVAYGRSNYNFEGRDDARVKAFLTGRPADAEGESIENGGLTSRGKGGPGAIRFPRRLYRYGDWSPRDRVLAEMERHCAANSGAFFFARPIYGDDTSTPRAVEYGVLRDVSDFWIERFLV